jgi:lipopolysaccharide biosynthesis glycosyltransferase/predicted O-methyltransferase YrrM
MECRVWDRDREIPLEHMGIPVVVVAPTDAAGSICEISPSLTAARLEWKFIKIRTDKSGENDRPNAVATARQAIDSTENPVVLSDLQSYTQGETSPDLIRDVFPRVFPTDNHIPETADAVITPNLISNLNYLKRIAADKSRLLDSYKNQQEFENLLGYKTGKRGVKFITNAYLKAIEILAPIIAERAAADKSYIVSQFDNASFPGSWIFAVRALATHNNLTHNWVASSYHQNVAALGDEFKLAEQFPEKILMLQEPVVDGDLRSAATALEIARRAKPHGVNLYTSDLGMGVLDLPLFFYKTPTTVLGKPFAVESPHIIASMQLNDNATMLISDQPLELKTVEPLVIPKADREEWAYTLQEQLHTRAHLGQAVCGLASLAPGGDIILKHYSLTTGLTQQIIAMLSSCFETAVIQKPLTSSGDNSECYFVGRGYKPNAAVLELLSNHLRNWSHQSINLVADEPLKKRLAVVAGIGARLIYSQCAYIRYHLGAPPKHLMVINGWTSVVNGRFSVATITTGPGLSDLEAHRAGRAKFAYDREKVAPEVGPVSQENQPVVLSVADAVAPSADTAAKLEAGRFAIATLVMGDPKYVLGAMALAQSLRLAGTRAQLVVMVETRLLQDKALEIALKTVFNKVYPVELLSYQTYMAGMTERQQTMYSSWISHSYTKWNCLRLPYEKVLMMDADTVAVQNLDHLFDMDAPSGSFHSPWFKSYQNEKGEPLAHGDLVPVEWIRNGLDGILTQEQRREFAQGREQGRVQRQKAERFFVAFATSMLLPGGLSAAAAGNSDKIFIEFNNFLIRESSRSQYGYGHKCNSGADEQSIVEFFNSKRHRWHDIGPAYNCIPRHSHMVPSGKVFVIHYHGTNPWDAKPGAWEDMVWWSKVVQSSDAFSQRMQALGSTLSATYFTGVINRNYRVAGVAGELKNSVVSYINRNRLADSAQSIREIGNLVKRSVINSVCQGLSILDLGFGEGGDIHKYASAKISQLIGIEPNAQRIELAKIRMQKVPAINSIATIHQGSGDDLSLINRAVVKPVDVVASFFSLSFFFGSQQQLKNLCECIDTALVPGGYFIGTTVDGTAVLSLLAEVGSKGRYESKSLGLYIEACEIPDGRKMPEYGDQIIWDLDSKTATRHHEYLVNLDRLSRELKQRGINMISGGPFPQTSQNGEIDKYNSMFQWFVYQKGRAVPTTAAVANVIAVSSTTSSSSSSSEPVERHSVESILAARGDVIIDVRVKKSMGINQDIQVIKAIGIAGHYFIQDTPDPDRFERIAAPTILVVNHEFMSDWNLKNIAAGKIDLVWCKTAEGYRQVVKLLKRHHLENMVKRVRNLGFTTLLPRELVYGSHEKNWHLWGHYAGKSNMKNSLAVLSAWSMAMVAKDFGGYSGKDFGKQNLLVITLAKSEDTKATKEIVKFYSKIDEVIDEQKDKAVKKAYLAPGVKIDGISLPACYLISPVIEGGNLVGGCAVFPEYLPVAEFQQLQQRTGWVIAPSAMEGYGHYINTARALSSPVISVDVAPMNELVDTRTGLLIPVDAKHMEKMKGLYVPQGYEVAVARPDKKDILDAVGRAAAISSSKARDLGLAGNREFHRQQTQVLGEYIQQPTTEIGRFSFSHRAEADQICEVLRDTIPTPKTIADITAGQGGVFFALHHWFPEAKFVAIEKSEDEFKHLAANAQRLGYSEAELVRGQAQDPDLYSRADLVFMDPPWGGPEYKNAAVVPMELENAGNFIQWLASVKDRLPATVAIKAPLNWDIAAATKVFDNWRLSSHDIYSWKEPGKVAYRLHIAQRNA